MFDLVINEIDTIKFKLMWLAAFTSNVIARGHSSETESTANKTRVNR